MANEVLKNDNSITLDWADISGATLYRIEVSKNYPDFRAPLLVDDNAVATSTKSFTATGNGIYYWRVTPYIGSWGSRREVNSFMVYTTASADVSATGWTFINKSDVTDVYLMENQPLSFRVLPEHFYEAVRRNRAGSIRSEHYTTKMKISLNMSWSNWGENQKAETMRFYMLHTSFYLATRYRNQLDTDYVYQCWECIFNNIPDMDNRGTTLDFEEK